MKEAKVQRLNNLEKRGGGGGEREGGRERERGEEACIYHTLVASKCTLLSVSVNTNTPIYPFQ